MGDCNVYITPTMKEVDALVECGVSIIATDATHRPRPDGKSLDEFFGEVRTKYPNQLFMADCSSYEEGIHAAEIGFDLVGTTMNGYTEYTKGSSLPNIELMKRLVDNCKKPIIAEGGIWLPEQLKGCTGCRCIGSCNRRSHYQTIRNHKTLCSCNI